MLSYIFLNSYLCSTIPELSFNNYRLFYPKFYKVSNILRIVGKPTGGQNVKKIWKIRRDEEAVSPVIATILMVAITVVLAAVLYIMVTTMTGGGQATPMGSMNIKGDSNTGATSERVYFGSINPTQKPTACKIILYDTTNNTKIGTYSFPSTDISALSNVTVGWGVTIKYTDLMDDKVISDGDYIDIDKLTQANSYKVTLVWISNGSEICSQTFNK